MNSQSEDKRMRQLLDEFIERKAEENQFYRSTVGMRPKPGPPAMPDELQKLYDYLASKGLHSPEAYTRFLRVYNGVEMLLYPVSLYSISEVIGKHDVIESMFDERPGCRQFIIGGSLRTGDKIAFDVNKPTPNGGYQIVWLLEPCSCLITRNSRECDKRRRPDFASKHLALCIKPLASLKPGFWRAF